MGVGEGERFGGQSRKLAERQGFEPWIPTARNGDNADADNEALTTLAIKEMFSVILNLILS